LSCKLKIAKAIESSQKHLENKGMTSLSSISYY